MRSFCVSLGLAAPVLVPRRTAATALEWPDGVAGLRQQVDAGVMGQGLEVAAVPLAIQAGRRPVPECEEGQADTCRAAGAPSAVRGGTASAQRWRPGVDARGIRLCQSGDRASAPGLHVVPARVAAVTRRARLAGNEARTRWRCGLLPTGVGGAPKQRSTGTEVDGATPCSPEGPVVGSSIAGPLIGHTAAPLEAPVG